MKTGKLNRKQYIYLWRPCLYYRTTEGFPQIMRKLTERLQKMDVDGKPLLRQDTHVDDAVQGILLSLEKDEAVGQDFNFVADAPYSSTKLCDIMALKYDWPIEEKNTNWHSWTTSNEKACSVLGYKPKINILNWLRDNLLSIPDTAND